MAAAQPIILVLRRAVWMTPAMAGNLEDPGWITLRIDLHRLQAVQDYLTIILTATFSLLVLYLAHRNHRTLERGASRIAIQAGMMAAGLVVAIAAYFGASHLAWSIIR